jgi:small-conductance mechanosensitive channel
MENIIETIWQSIQEMVGETVAAIPGLLTALIILLLTRFVAKFIQRLAYRLGKQVLRNNFLQLLLSKTSYIFTWTIGIVLACTFAFPGFSLGDVVTTLGLSSIAIGFAFQDIFKNFLAGILLLLQQPFRIKDQIIIDGYEGTVEDISIRTTQIRTYQGERVILPNSMVFTSAIQVRTAFPFRRTDLAVGVDYNTPLGKAREVLQQTLGHIKGVVSDPVWEIDIISFGDSSIDLLVRYWTEPDQTTVRRTQTQVIMAIKAAFDQADINIPYPIRTVYHFEQQKFNE